MGHTIFHHLPSSMKGSVLYPMNQLKDIDRQLFDTYRKGYEGREKLLERRLPFIDCLWNDVLHCSPVHPERIIQAMRDQGIVEGIPHLRYFEIDTDLLDMEQAIIYFREGSGFDDVRFVRALDIDWAEVDVIPDITLRHYHEVAEGREELFAYHGIPHVLYKGIIDTKSLPILQQN